MGKRPKLAQATVEDAVGRQILIQVKDMHFELSINLNVELLFLELLITLPSYEDPHPAAESSGGGVASQAGR